MARPGELPSALGLHDEDLGQPSSESEGDPPGLTSGASSISGSSPSTGARAQQQLQRAGLGAHGGGGYGALDEIDRSDPELWEEEEEDEYGDEDDAYGEEDFLGGYPGLLGGLMGAGGAGAGVLGGPVDDTLLRQIPVQDLLNALIGSAEAGLPFNGGAGVPWPLELVGARASAQMPGSRVHIPGVAGRIPAGLDPSARRHALFMAEQGFSTALDPARHAACAAEGVRGGRRLASPRAAPVAPRQPQQPQQQQQMAAAAAPSALHGLQRGDSAAVGGGLQRGDSAGSQGMSRVAQQAAGATSGGGVAGGGAAGMSRLGSTAHSGVAPVSHLLSSGGSQYDTWPELSASASGDSSSEAEQAQAAPAQSQQQQQQQQQAAGAGSSSQQSGGSRGASPGPPRRRPRRNAIFGSLPGMGASGGGMPLPASSGDESGEEGSPRHDRAAARRARRGLRGSGAGSHSPQALIASGSSSDDDLPPPLIAGADSDEPPPLGRAAGSDDDGLPGLLYGVDSASSVSSGPPGLGASLSSDGPPDLDSDGASVSESSGSGSEDDGEGLPGMMTDSAGSSAESEGETVPSLVSGAEDSGSSSGASQQGGRLPPRPVPGSRQQVPFDWQRSAAAAGTQPRSAFTADQRSVMQALTSLLPERGDAAGWSELAAHARRHSRAGSSGGGVQLLSRLVASAASRYPAEVEGAGLTERPLLERPLAPPPTLVANTATTTAINTADNTAPGSPGSPAVGASGMMSAATSAAIHAAAVVAAVAAPGGGNPAGTSSGPAAAAAAATATAAPPRTAELSALALSWLPPVTFVAASAEAASELQQQLGPAVHVAVDGEPAARAAALEAAWQAQREAEAGAAAGALLPQPPPAVLFVLPDGQADALGFQLPPPALGVAQGDYLAAFEEHEAYLEASTSQLRAAHRQLQQYSERAAAAAGPSAAAAGAGLDANLQQAAAMIENVQASVGHVVATAASLRQNLRVQQRAAVVSAEGLLRSLAAAGAAGGQPLPPLVAAGVAAAASPPPQQAEE